MRARPALASLAVAALLLAGEALGATIYLKDGTKVEGEIVDRDEREIRVRLPNGKLRTIRVPDVKSIDEPLPPPPKVEANETGDAPIDKRSREVERWLGLPLVTAATDLVVVRGDHPLGELTRMAQSCEKAARHFLSTFECQPADALRVADSYGGTVRIEVYQFVKEDGYLAFVDKVLARMRDHTVDDARLGFMRRQRGFWIVSPRPLLAQYQGPSEFTTSVAAACHKVSHEMLAGWKPSGGFMPWWLYEGLATWQEFAVLGESRTYCIEIARPGDYARPGTPEADEAAKARLESNWKKTVKEMVRRRNEKDFAVLGRLSLNELVFADVQQGWSIVDWLHRTSRLKAFVASYKQTRDLDAACREALGAPVAAAHDAWRQWVARAY
jgi:hypothetical protein